MSNNNINKKNFYYVNYVISHHPFVCSKHRYRNATDKTHIKVQVAAGLTGFLLS